MAVLIVVVSATSVLTAAASAFRVQVCGCGIVLVFAGSDTAFVAPLTPVWSKPLGKGVRFVGVEEYGRCILFVDNGAIQVVLPSGETAWSWPYKENKKTPKIRSSLRIRMTNKRTGTS
jgi:hypothetical protein